MGLFFNKPKMIRFRGVVNRMGMYYSETFCNYYAIKLMGFNYDIIKFYAMGEKIIVDLALTKENDEIEFILEEKNSKDTPKLVEFKNLSL